MNTLLLLSGGLDSAVLLWDRLRRLRHGPVRCLAVDYGQRHRCELDAARDLAKASQVPIDVVALPTLGGSSLTGEGPLAGTPTVVPGRNLLLLSLAGASAVANGCDTVAFACHRGDHAIYPDCRPGFIAAAALALRLGNVPPITLLTPFLDLPKASIVRLGASLGVPFALTWSCYAGGTKHCGQCGACEGRRAAFAEASVTDPTEYA